MIHRSAARTRPGSGILAVLVACLPLVIGCDAGDEPGGPDAISGESLPATMAGSGNDPATPTNDSAGPDSVEHDPAARPMDASADGEADSEVGSLGMVLILQETTSEGSTRVHAAATFLSFASPRRVNVSARDWLPTLDACEVTNGEAAADDDKWPAEDLARADAIWVDAGDQIVLSDRSGGSWLELDLTRTLGYAAYGALGGPIDGVLPGDLVLDVPGGTFPSFDNTGVPVAEPLRELLPAAGGEVGPGTVFRWRTGTGDSRVNIRFESIDPATDEVTRIACVARDDGEFELPRTTRTILGPAFMASGVEYARSAFTVRSGAGALLLVASIATPVSTDATAEAIDLEHP